ncbi:Heat shock protein Hsp70 [Macrophomina phaseolina MS6]|uniref:Heat shock protein Hsp70 n=1 Tax=Macrophomina phaseolina (strain MS6) TaxID=1126212 RepID=K2QWR3_MACPH|nr:Heat shock protein Hsp70 [Macrophomina phaseolina MS6]
MDYGRTDLFANLHHLSLSNQYLIAVDFGTTFSGLAWASRSGSSEIRIINQWPSGRTDEKTATTIRYEENGDILWGSDIPHHLPKHEWFKLGLEPLTYNESKLTTKYPSFVAAQGDVLESEKLIVDYLSALRRHAEKELDAALLRAKVINKRQRSIKYIITIPAIWTDKAKDTMRTLASRAGMGEQPQSIQVVTEPEAAAMHELKERTKRGQTPDLEVNDTFVICDAGGGTVDLISYTITQLYPHPVVKEATSGSGGKCGSTFLNRIFAEWLKRHLGDEPEWHEDVLSRAVSDFDPVKTTFQLPTGRSQHHYVIEIPRFWELPEKGITRGTLRLTQQDMESIFRPVVKEIIALVNDQIAGTAKKAKTVFLVGGFGQNVYLRDTLQRAVGPDVKIKKSMDPRARKHYGTEALDSYDPAKHDRRRQVIDGFTGDTKAWVMKWFMRKDEPILSSKPQLIPFYYEQKVSDGRPRKVSVKIFCSQSEKAPLHKDDQVSELVEVTADLNRIPEHEFNREFGSNNQEYYKLDFDIEMKCESATTEYRLVYRGKRYDVVRAEYA